ncbi:cysteine desulfurase family protein [Listeria sp. PSOL-1]|uniref:cysteine desulfurase family protein n=1 Tax=Listeria sp. PSOL-1 TaxID=1844999 RepID=UPI0013D7E8FA|nr:cysteine desulfurase family protein [Listeria sp. PSOL-1]
MIYFDNSATTKPYQAVLETYTKVASHYFANPSSLHQFGQKVRELHEEARKQTAQLLDVKPEEVIFTSGGTESNNLAIKGIARRYSARGKHMITTEIEHPAVKEVMKELALEGFTITYLPVDQNGRVSCLDLEKALTAETILVSIMHVNNEVGVIQPIEELSEIVKTKTNAYFHVDQVQGIAKVPLQLKNVDLLSISGHKLHGLNGTGILVKRKNVELHSEIRGGGQEFDLRSGTENTAGAVAFAKALRLELENMAKHLNEMKAIQRFLRQELTKIPHVVLHTSENFAAPHILCFSVKGHRGEVLVHALAKEEIFLSTTSACSSRSKLENSTLRAMGVPDHIAVSAIRLSLSYTNQLAEAEIFVQTFKHVIQKLNEVVK